MPVCVISPTALDPAVTFPTFLISVLSRAQQFAQAGLLRSERLGETILACLRWSIPAWKMAARDRWIGWNDQQRKINPQRIVNHGRFLILPWVAVKEMASKILALSARQMPRARETRYGCRPLLLETLVDAARKNKEQ
jgi:hypothetical protein